MTPAPWMLMDGGRLGASPLEARTRSHRSLLVAVARRGLPNLVGRRSSRPGHVVLRHREDGRAPAAMACADLGVHGDHVVVRSRRSTILTRDGGPHRAGPQWDWRAAAPPRTSSACGGGGCTGVSRFPVCVRTSRRRASRSGCCPCPAWLIARRSYVFDGLTCSGRRAHRPQLHLRNAHPDAGRDLVAFERSACRYAINDVSVFLGTPRRARRRAVRADLARRRGPCSSTTIRVPGEWASPEPRSALLCIAAIGVRRRDRLGARHHGAGAFGVVLDPC